MTNLLRPGRLEVETDLLLGAEEVLLPVAICVPKEVAHSSAAESPRAVSTTTTLTSPRVPAPVRGFEAALFAPRPTSGDDRSTPTPTRRDDHLIESKPSLAVSSGSAAESLATITSGPPVQVVIEDRIVPPSGASGATDKPSRLEALRVQHASDCPHCTRATGFTNLVFGEGNPNADIVFVGEAPGETEDQTGRPFVGKAGEKLDEMIRAMGFTREDVYIANVLKARPPGNRTPLAQEIERCGPYLLAQLAVIRPKAIVTLGGPATKLLLQSELGITRLRGVLHEVTLGRAEGRPFTAPVMPTFHPAYLLRNYTVEVRRQMWDDLKQVLAILAREPGARDGAAS